MPAATTSPTEHDAPPPQHELDQVHMVPLKRGRGRPKGSGKTQLNINPEAICETRLRTNTYARKSVTFSGCVSSDDVHDSERKDPTFAVSAKKTGTTTGVRQAQTTVSTRLLTRRLHRYQKGLRRCLSAYGIFTTRQLKLNSRKPVAPTVKRLVRDVIGGVVHQQKRNMRGRKGKNTHFAAATKLQTVKVMHRANISAKTTHLALEGGFDMIVKADSFGAQVQKRLSQQGARKFPKRTATLKYERNAYAALFLHLKRLVEVDPPDFIHLMTDETPGTFGGCRCQNTMVWLFWWSPGLRSIPGAFSVNGLSGGRVLLPTVYVATKRGDELFHVLRDGLQNIGLGFDQLSVFLSDQGNECTSAYAYANNQTTKKHIFFSPCLAHILSNCERKAAKSFGRVDKFVRLIVKQLRWHWDAVSRGLKSVAPHLADTLTKPSKPLDGRWHSHSHAANWIRRNTEWIVGNFETFQQWHQLNETELELRTAGRRKNAGMSIVCCKIVAYRYVAWQVWICAHPTPADPVIEARRTELSERLRVLRAKLDECANRRRHELGAHDFGDGVHASDRLTRRVRLDVGGGFISAFLWDPDKRELKNDSLQQLCQTICDPVAWCDCLVYAAVTSINTSIFQWLRDAATSGRLLGERRVQLAADGVQHISELFTKLHANAQFVQPIATDCQPFLAAARCDPQYVSTRIQLLATRLKNEFLKRSDFLCRPPSMLAAMAGPLVLCNSLAEQLRHDVPNCDVIFADSPLLRSGCPVLTEDQNKSLVRKFLDMYDSSEQQSGSAWRHPLCDEFFRPDSELRKSLELYSTSEAAVTLSRSAELLQLRRKLVEIFVAPPLTTQDIEGVHGVMTSICRGAPNMRLPRISIRLSGRLNGDLCAPDFQQIADSPDTEIKSQLAQFLATEKERHRTDALSHTFWRGSLAGTMEAQPEVPSSTKAMWLGMGSRQSIAEDFLKLVSELLPLQTWFGRKCSSGQGWEEIFRIIRPECSESSASKDLAFLAVKKNGLSIPQRMELETSPNYDAHRFVGQAPHDLCSLHVLSVSVEAGILSLDEPVAGNSLFQFRHQLLTERKVSSATNRELAWMICAKYPGQVLWSEDYDDLRRRSKSSLITIWKKGVSPPFMDWTRCLFVRRAHTS